MKTALLSLLPLLDALSNVPAIQKLFKGLFLFSMMILCSQLVIVLSMGIATYFKAVRVFLN